LFGELDGKGGGCEGTPQVMDETIEDAANTAPASLREIYSREIYSREIYSRTAGRGVTRDSID
jgi:hypothetical protein